MLQPEDQVTGSKKSAAKKSRVKVRDLMPQNNPLGGSGITRNDPPLPIPPPGFIMNSDGDRDGRK